MKGRKPVVQCTASEWRELCDLARAAVAPPFRYSWRFVWSASMLAAGDEGAADLRPLPHDLQPGERGVALVKVAKGLAYTHTRETLIHEMAHCKDSWRPSGERGHHDAHFWLEYGIVYLAMMGERTG